MTPIEDLIARLRPLAEKAGSLATDWYDDDRPMAIVPNDRAYVGALTPAVVLQLLDALSEAIRVTEIAEHVAILCDWYIAEALPLPITFPLPQKHTDPSAPPSVTIDEQFFRAIARWRNGIKDRK